MTYSRAGVVITAAEMHGPGAVSGAEMSGAGLCAAEVRAAEMHAAGSCTGEVSAAAVAAGKMHAVAAARGGVGLSRRGDKRQRGCDDQPSLSHGFASLISWWALVTEMYVVELTAHSAFGFNRVAALSNVIVDEGMFIDNNRCAATSSAPDGCRSCLRQGFV
jgi:hypothetical protein